jgi:hypothetical protein
VPLNYYELPLDAVTAEAASSSLVVPAILFLHSRYSAGRIKLALLVILRLGHFFFRRGCQERKASNQNKARTQYVFHTSQDSGEHTAHIGSHC